MSMTLSRRNFLIASGLAAATPWRSALGANDDIRVAILGAGWRGGQLMPPFSKTPGVRVVAICDPDHVRAADLARKAEALADGRKVETETDLRKVFDRKDVDAVVVATPNHWHALAAIWAIEAGKDVYVEKPVAYTIWEGRQIVEAAKKHNRIVQGGTQRRSYPELTRLFERVRSGEFGPVKQAHALVYRLRDPIGKRDTPLPIPAEVDYDLWAGPAPKEPIYRDQFHYDWHWNWSTGNAELGNNGPHVLDLVRSALGQEQLAPAVMSVGGRLGWDDSGETPNTQVVLYDYKPAPIICEIRNMPAKPGTKPMDKYQGISSGFVLACENASIVGLDNVEIRDRDGKVAEQIKAKGSESLHPANFIKAVRSRNVEELNAPIPVAHVSCALTLQGNISHRLGATVSAEEAVAANKSNPAVSESLDRMLSHLEANKVRVDSSSGLVLGPMLTFDPSTEKFTGDLADRANALTRRESYRGPFVVREIS